VKRRVPIWKKEFYRDGSDQWVGAGIETGDADAERPA
jgi:molybdopterin synthase catalytic subunit